MTLQDRGLEDVWIMDSGCSRHMTGHHRWFSSLNPMDTKEYITFGDNGQEFEVRFKKGACRVLDTEETLVCSLLPFGQVELNGPNPRIAQIENREGFSVPPVSSWQDGCHFSHSCVSGYDLLSG
ncbi:hypothetical protein U9M48_024931 [Paspalum notatum var. saurae]|uniref:Retrovirus-related Pol polyprotein from transposon TNT 1-94-like beta-barrel domain-containing protein n=1 Tax=Paspalum notatum var. saurae TaxID=547442 RepID=A0AAQ3TPA6_PASNO